SSLTNFTNIHHFLSIKLTSKNYLIWQSQFLPLLNGYDLMQFVDGSSSPPPRYLSYTPVDIHVLNPDFLAWYKQDQLLLSWILSSLTESVHAQVVGLTTSLWSALAAAFASPSQERVMQLHLDLHNVSKGADSMAVYLQKVKSISDALALASTPVSDEDFIIYILGGLGDEYRAFVSSISTQSTLITLADLHGLLLTEEIRAQSALMHLSNASANTATKTSNPDSRQNHGRGHSSSARMGRGKSNSHFSAPHSSYIPPHPLCQICNQPRHSALNCPQRF
ncbi:UBN2_3 domain-containing protein, partial [Cephalotus follicularis]